MSKQSFLKGEVENTSPEDGQYWLARCPAFKGRSTILVGFKLVPLDIIDFMGYTHCVAHKVSILDAGITFSPLIKKLNELMKGVNRQKVYKIDHQVDLSEFELIPEKY